MRKTFKEFVFLKEEAGANPNKDWRADSAAAPLKKGFIPPTKLRPIIRAFLNSDKIVLQRDTAKPITMPKKTLYLVGGPVRDFIKGKSIKDLDLATNATPEQIAVILSAAGFKHAGDRSGQDGEQLRLPSHFENEDGKVASVEDASKGDNKVWYIKGRDNSKDRKVFVIGAVVDGEEFDIATFRKDAKVEDGKAAVDFTDNPQDDAARRDLTINSLYIELSKADGENKTVFDPTKTGMHDLNQGVVKTVGKADDRFEEDPIRVMRAIRFHCKFGKGDLHEDIRKAIPKFVNLHERVAMERIRDEFLKGLMDPDVDSSKYINTYKKTGLLSTIFPNVTFDSPNGVPTEFTDKKDKVLALAWLLQHNSPEQVSQVLAPEREVSGESKPTGWQTEERRAITFLLKLKGFTPDKVGEFVRAREGTGLSSQQIKDWVDMFKKKGTNQHTRPWWAKQGHAFADHRPSVSWEQAQAKGHDVCAKCGGQDYLKPGCDECRGTGKLAPHKRGEVMNKLAAEEFKKKLGPTT